MRFNDKRLWLQRGRQRGTARFATLLAVAHCFLTAEVRGQVSAVMPATQAQADSTTTARPQSDPNDPMAPHDPGIYYIQQGDGGGRMIPLEPAPLAVTAGSTKWTAVINGSQARIRVRDGRPTFYFYIPPNPTGFPGVPGGGSSVTSPSEFALARLESKKNEREVPLEKAKIAHKRNPRSGVLGMPADRGASAEEVQAQRISLSVADKERVPFTYDKLAAGIYKVQPKAELGAGEYGFVYSGSLQMPDGRLFDFGIEGVK